MASFELAGSIKEAIFSSMHAGTAEPFRVTPPEAVVYQDSIKTKLLLTTKDFSGFLCCEQSPPPQQGGDFSP